MKKGLSFVLLLIILSMISFCVSSDLASATVECTFWILPPEGYEDWNPVGVYAKTCEGNDFCGKGVWSRCNLNENYLDLDFYKSITWSSDVCVKPGTVMHYYRWCYGCDPYTPAGGYLYQGLGSFVVPDYDYLSCDSKCLNRVGDVNLQKSLVSNACCGDSRTQDCAYLSPGTGASQLLCGDIGEPYGTGTSGTVMGSDNDLTSANAGETASGSALYSVIGRYDWIWQDPVTHAGDIRYIPCAGFEVVSDGQKWVGCGSGEQFDGTVFSESSPTLNIGGHDYYCSQKGFETIYECAGSYSSTGNSLDDDLSPGGVRLGTGESLKKNISFDPTNQLTWGKVLGPYGIYDTMRSQGMKEPIITNMDAVARKDYTWYVMENKDGTTYRHQKIDGYWMDSVDFWDWVEENPDLFDNSVGVTTVDALEATDSYIILISGVYYWLWSDICPKEGISGGCFEGPYQYNSQWTNEGMVSAPTHIDGLSYDQFSDIWVVFSGDKYWFKTGKVWYGPYTSTVDVFKDIDSVWHSSDPNHMLRVPQYDETAKAPFYWLVTKGDSYYIVSREDSGEDYQYCTKYYRFTPDLDIIDDIGVPYGPATAAQADTYGASCVGAGFTWTGTMCCSEGDDPGEFYNDIGSDNTYTSCWAKVPQKEDSIVKTSIKTYDNLFVSGGFVHGCNVGTEYGSVIDTHTGAQMVTDSSYCKVLGSDSSGYYYCSYDGNWTASPDARTRTSLKSAPWTINLGESQADCCEPDQCWNGTGCVDSVANESRISSIQYQVGGKNYRCINGGWEAQDLKWSWDYSTAGFCPSNSQCLVNPDGTDTNGSFVPNYGGQIDSTVSTNNLMMCLNNTRWVADHYCEEGAWTSRTKRIALQMIESAGINDYNIFCGDYATVLNRYDYLVGSAIADKYLREMCVNMMVGSIPIASGVGVSCVNKLCVMQYGPSKKVVIGASLNQPINSQTYSFLSVLGKGLTSCDGSSIMNNADDYAQCGSNDLWYNDKLQSVIYAQDGISLMKMDLWSLFTEIIQNPFNAIFDTILRIIQPEIYGIPLQFDLIEGTRDFNTIYLEKKGDRYIYAVKEYSRPPSNLTSDANTFVSVNYNMTPGFADICLSINKFDEEVDSPSVSMQTIRCNQTADGSFYVESIHTKGFKQWSNLTAMQRLK